MNSHTAGSFLGATSYPKSHSRFERYFTGRLLFGLLALTALLGASASPASAIEPNGTRIYDQTNGEIYLVDEGELRHVPGVETYDQLFVDWSGLTSVPNTTGLPIRTPLPTFAYLVRVTGQAEVYLIDCFTNCAHPGPGFVKRHVLNPDVMTKYHFSWDQVVILDNDSWLSTVPQGTTLE